MTKDDRLYARFDIGMDENAKVMLLSDAAFRALIESTLYARRQLTDGFLAEGVVVRKWGRDVAPELTTNHPERPSWVPVEGGWKIRDYEKHQTTNADIEAKREAGRLGGLAKAKRTASTGVAPASETVEQKASTHLAKTETETKKETGTTYVVPSSAPRQTKGTRIPEEFFLTPAMRDYHAERFPQVDIRLETEKFVYYWRAKSGASAIKIDWESVWRNWIITAAERSGTPAQKPTKTDRAMAIVEMGRERDAARARKEIA